MEKAKTTDDNTDAKGNVENESQVKKKKQLATNSNKMSSKLKQLNQVIKILKIVS